MRKTKYFTFFSGITPENLKKQYRDLSKQYHPDKPTGDHTKFAEINVEYHSLLKDLAEKANQQNNTVEHSHLTFLIEKHFQNILFHINHHQSLYNAIYQEIKQPLISFLPQKYQPFMNDLALLIEKHIKKGN